MPNAVSRNEPKTCRQTAENAVAQRCACIRVTISNEKLENVVRLPRKPVISKSFHCGLSSYSAQMPIKSAPIQLAASVPAENGTESAAKARTSNQRDNAPKAAPKATAMTF